MHAGPPSLKRHGLAVSLLAALWVTACGGSFSGGGAGGTGATSGSGGSGGALAGAGGLACDVACPAIVCVGTSVTRPGDCCPTCEPYGGSGGASNGGSGGISSGGGLSNAGGSCTGCPAIACAVGYKYVTQPGACCPTCVPDDSGGSGGASCTISDCPPSHCANGYVALQEPNTCCPVCVPGSECSAGQERYQGLRSDLLSQPGAVACKVDQDCTLLAGNAYCGDACSDVPVNAAAAPTILGQLSSFAKQNCSTCSPVYPPCAAPLPPVCTQGACTRGTFYP